MSESKLQARIMQLESALAKEQDDNRADKLRARVKHLEGELSKAHEANRNLRAQLAAGPADARREAALKLASERGAAVETYKEQSVNLTAQRDKLDGEKAELTKRMDQAVSAVNELNKRLKEKEAQLKDLSAEFDRLVKVKESNEEIESELSA
jgi:chromosome segregation ATPase